MELLLSGLGPVVQAAAVGLTRPGCCRCLSLTGPVGKTEGWPGHQRRVDWITRTGRPRIQMAARAGLAFQSRTAGQSWFRRTPGVRAAPRIAFARRLCLCTKVSGWPRHTRRWSEADWRVTMPGSTPTEKAPGLEGWAVREERLMRLRCVRKPRDELQETWSVWAY